jgi:hypothetical protein
LAFYLKKLFNCHAAKGSTQTSTLGRSTAI